MEQLTFLFDPRSPWCYQTSRWARRLEELGEVRLDWGVLSLEVMNLKEHEDRRTYDAEYGPALRVAVALRAAHGSDAIGRFYAELGRLMWEEETTAAPMAELTGDAVERIGLDRSFVGDVLADPETWDAVLAEHDHWVAKKAFGVPTLMVGGGDDQYMLFGPVVRSLPSDEDAVALWRHTLGLAAYGTIFEVKKDRALSMRADLPTAVARADARVAQMRAGRALLKADPALADASLEWAMSQVRAGATS